MQPPLRPGHSLQLLLDGTAHGTPTNVPLLQLVEIDRGDHSIAVQVLAGNQADAIVNWMPDALAAREAGVPLVNIAQIFDKSGLMLTCKKASGVASPKDFKGKTLGVWFGGNEYPFLNWMNKLGLKTDGSDVMVLKQVF